MIRPVISEVGVTEYGLTRSVKSFHKGVTSVDIEILFGSSISATTRFVGKRQDFNRG